MDKEEFESIIKRYKEGTCTPAERELVHRWINEYAKSTQKPDLSPEALGRTEKKLWLKIYKEVRPASSSNMWYRISAAAAIIFIGGFLLFQFFPSTRTGAPTAQVQDVRPGGNKAFITLSNGVKISLDSIAAGAAIDGTNISKTDSGSIRFENLAGTGDGEHEMNTITTPKGGQYHVTLDDGTEVWLNAASSLTAPVSFTSTGNRFVRVTGEAYFQVAKDRKRPFIVETATQRVRVLGTHFNINSYADEQAVSTTLLEGSVELVSTKANSRLTLIPGQTANYQNDQFTVRPANDDVIAWKSGKIKFEATGLQPLMRQLSRWYNIEIIYDGPSRNRQFTGTINRTYSLKVVVDILNGMGIESRLENRGGQTVLVVKS